MVLRRDGTEVEPDAAEAAAENATADDTTADDTTEPTRGTRSRRRPSWGRLPVAWRRGIVAAVALRAAAAVVGLVAGGLLPGLEPVSVPPREGFAGWLATAPAEQGWGILGAGLERFDALWYLAIAADGYPIATAPPDAAAFFPGYPVVVAAVALLFGGAHLLAANLVSLAATAAGMAGLHRLTEHELGDIDADAPRRAVVALAVFPSAFFLVAPYTEGLFLAASVWGLVHLRRGRWLPAAAALVVAGATRNVGILLALPAAIELWRRRADRPGASGAVALLAAPAGLGVYLAYGWVRWGTWLAPIQVQTGWQRELTAPWVTLADAVRTGFGSPGLYASGYHGLDLLVALPVLAAVVWLLVRGPRSLALFALANVAVWLVYPFPGRPLMSTPRFALAVAPVFLAVAAWTSTRTRETVWLAISAALLGVHLLLFSTWYYVF